MTETRTLSGRLRSTIREIVDRRVVPWLVAYLAGAWVLLEASSFMVDEYGWPSVILQILPVLLAFGVLSTITLAWFHGAAGWQRLTAKEVGIHGAIAVATLVTLLYGPVPELSSMASSSPPLKRIAVLYFKDHSDGRFTTLTRDLTEGVVHELAQAEPLEVLPLTSVRPYRDDATGTEQVARELEVGALVEGSVTAVGDSVRVTAQLIEAESQAHLASQEWVVPVARVESGTRRVATEIANQIRHDLGEEVRDRELAAGAPDEEALELYRRGERIFREEAAVDWQDDRVGGLALLAEADSLLAEAERRAPEWAAPSLLRCAVAADRSLLRGRAGERSREDLRAGIRHAERALARVPNARAAALEWRGKLRFALARHSPPEAADTLMAAAEHDLREAVRLEPGRAGALMALSDLAGRQGKFNAAHRYAVRAIEADAFLELGPGTYSNLINSTLQLERVEEADTLAQLGRRRFPYDQEQYQKQLLVIASMAQPTDRDIRRAWAVADTLAELGLVERRTEWRAYAHFLVAAALARAGLADSADAVIRRARIRLDSLDAGPGMTHGVSYFEAYARLNMGQPDSALAALDHYTEAYASRAAALASDWWFRPLRGDPRFHEITGTSPVADRP